MNRFHDLTIEELADMWEVAQCECLTAGLEGNHKSVEFWRKIFNEVIEEIEKIFNVDFSNKIVKKSEIKKILQIKN